MLFRSTITTTNRPQIVGKVFALTAAEAEGGNETVQGILSLYGSNICVLFDTCSTHSFITPHVLHLVPVVSCSLPYILSITTSSGSMLLGDVVVRNCEIVVHY